ncbi:MAG: hypothetical protein DWQ07_01225 [Chloroflexi bacterium]|nr:MAG: hypothetical protein DWQ07_01225 [Chloroflexota bacterium]MBL1196495.1 hypothetical protein [Chloroflexota bacterium]NOH13790.1 hypothetical protein [Chloroflexota bacterium]
MGSATILQVTVVGRINMLEGAADLVLLVLLGWVLHARAEGVWQWGVLAGAFIGITSAQPVWLPIISYLSITAVGYLIQTRVWQIPLLNLLTTTIAGTLIIHSLTSVYLTVIGTPLQLSEIFNLVILPSIFLNLLIALPIYSVMTAITNWVYPPEVEV